MKSKKALATIIFVACVVLTGCRSQLTPLGNGLYHDKETSLQDIVNTAEKKIVPPYANEVTSLHNNMFICRSPENLENNGIPVFFAECERIDSLPECIDCFSDSKMYLYALDSDLAQKPLSPCRCSIADDTLYLEHSGLISRYHLAYPDIKDLPYVKPLSRKRSFAAMKPDRKIIAGIAHGNTYYAMRIVTQKNVCAEENFLFCHSTYGLAYGENIGGFWTFFIPSAPGTPATITEVPKKSWLVYDKTRCQDFLIIRQKKRWIITTLNGRQRKKMTRREWRTLRLTLENQRGLGGIHIAEIACMHLLP